MSEFVKGIIIKGLGGLYDVKTDGGEVISCKAKGAFRHEKMTPYAGDRVVLKKSDKGVVVEEIEERKNYLIRPPVANLDILFTVIAAAKPSPMLPITDKLISIAEYNKIEPVIIVSKSDLDEAMADSIAEIYEKSRTIILL